MATPGSCVAVPASSSLVVSVEPLRQVEKVWPLPAMVIELVPVV